MASFTKLSKPTLESSPFFIHILDVIGWRPEKEMRGIDTRRIITFMTNKEAVGDWSVCENPG